MTLTKVKTHLISLETTFDLWGIPWQDSSSRPSTQPPANLSSPPPSAPYPKLTPLQTKPAAQPNTTLTALAYKLKRLHLQAAWTSPLHSRMLDAHETISPSVSGFQIDATLGGAELVFVISILGVHGLAMRCAIVIQTEA